MSIEARGKRLRVPEGISKLLRDLIHERTGIFFEDTRMELLLDKLEPLGQACECQSFLDYYYILKNNEGSEWLRAWDALSVQETYFCRELSQVNALVEKIVPEWFATRASPYRIWCAACATGEEPYSIAMALEEAGLGGHPVEIMASDASPSALEKAQAAVYREHSFRTLPVALRQKYFEPAGSGWKLSRNIASRVRFRRANLLEPSEIAPMARVQAIFCRNVFIYFSPHSVRQAVATFALRMAPGSHLFVGAAESLLRLTADFELQEVVGALAYVRI